MNVLDVSVSEVSDKTTWDSVGDPMAAAQALLGASKPSGSKQITRISDLNLIETGGIKEK